MLRAPCDLGKKTSVSLPQIQGNSGRCLFSPERCLFSFQALRAPYDLGKKMVFVLTPHSRTKFKAPQKGVVCSPSTGALLVLLPGLETLEGRRVVSFHLLRAPYDLGRKTFFSLPQIRGTLSFHVLRAPCDLGKKIFFLTPNSSTSEGRCLFSFHRVVAWQKDVFFLTPT